MWVNEVPVIKLIVASSHPLLFANKALNNPNLGKLNIPLYFSMHTHIANHKKKKKKINEMFILLNPSTYMNKLWYGSNITTY